MQEEILQLYEKINALAYYLKQQGVRTNDFVVIMAERSIEMLIALYGVLKAGGAYVPVDPEYPDERIEYILEDCSPKAILTYRVELNRNIAKEIPIIDMEKEPLWNCQIEQEMPTVGPDDLAYCIYTSGTTGKPKGVMIKQKNVVNYITPSNMSTMSYAFDKGLKKCVSVTNMVFDIFVTEAILTLCNGMTVYIANKEQQKDLIAFRELVLKNGIEILQTTPSRIKGLFAQNPNTDCFSKMRYIMLGGEAVGTDIVDKIKKVSEAVVENVYGPSETTVWSTCLQIDKNYSQIPIGKPISNTQIYILQKDVACGLGIPGELCIAGDGVAKGYLNRDDLTKEKFVINPFGEDIMYHTGDLARWLPDGNIEYLGRMDEQVKIRGFRIELGEIDSRLREIESVRDCAVITKTDQYGEKVICAYIVGENIELAEMRKRLSSMLPEYMIPAYMMRIEMIPVTKSGKLDRRALPDIEVKSEEAYLEPRNEVEEIICKAFEEILQINRVGIYDNFFTLGGDSIKAIRVITRIRENGYNASVRDIMNGKTPDCISNLVQREENNTLSEESDSNISDSEDNLSGYSDSDISEDEMKLLNEMYNSWED